jgi:HSP20 family molecular chaperone IbpA
VNQVRVRAGIPGVSVNSIDVIYKERRFELSGEGHRFFDLARWGIAETVLKSKGFVKGRNEFFPVPQAELGVMPNLTQYPK